MHCKSCRGRRGAGGVELKGRHLRLLRRLATIEGQGMCSPFPASAHPNPIMRVRMLLPLVVSSLMVFAACNSSDTSAQSKAEQRVTTKRVELKDANGRSVGTAILKAQDKGIAIELDVRGLTPGEH